MSHSIGVFIPTFQARHHLPFCLPPLLQSPLKPRLLLLDSSSTDGTVEYAQQLGIETHVIPQHEFNHGLTREKGRRLLGTSIVVMMTQDAYATSSHMLNYLVDPLIKQQASIAYARQLPHPGADFFEAFAREYNYPDRSHIRGIQDFKQWGSYTFFCSNSCAAYSQSALDEIGGFSSILFGEDTIAVAKLLRQHHQIAYVAEAQVCHSHRYNLKQEFCRHFDMGLARQMYQELLAVKGEDTKRGHAYVKTMLKKLLKTYPQKIPYALLQTAAKFCGYQLGRVWGQVWGHA